MTRFTLVWKSLLHYFRHHLGMTAGFALASGVIMASLAVGDSVRHTLGSKAEARLSGVDVAVTGGDRFFTTEWLDRVMADKTAQGVRLAPVLFLRGAVSNSEGTQRVNQVQIIGIDERFAGFATSGSLPGGGGPVLNEALAARLMVKSGDAVIIRVEKPGALPKDAPLSGSTENDVPLRRTIKGIADATQMGEFALQTGPGDVMTVFLPMSDLQTMIEQEGKANVILASGIGADLLPEMLRQHWTLADLGLALAEVPDGGSQIVTSRVFLDPPLENALKSIYPGSKPVTTYLVNAITTDKGATPYSMATAADEVMEKFAPDAPADGVLIHAWLAEDQGLKLGDKLRLHYFRLGESRKLINDGHDFTVAGILPADSPVLNPSWTPEFPGVSDAENCRDWDPGVPVDLDAIRDKDEEYWDEFKGTPKVFLRLALGESLWRNRFGVHSAVRFAAPAPTAAAVEEALRSKLTLAETGLATRDLATEAALGAKGAVQFDQLFLAMSFFLIASALVLAALLLLFLLEQRSNQIGLLLGMGFTKSAVSRMLMAESLLVATIGTVVGLLAGAFMSRLALHGLNTWWAGATGGMDFQWQASPASFATAFLSTMILGSLVVWLVLRSLLKANPQALLSGSRSGLSSMAADKKRFLFSPWFWGLLFLIGAIALLSSTSRVSAAEVPALFFGAGMLLLLAGISIMALFLRWLRSGKIAFTSVWQLGMSNAARRPGRSIAIAGLMGAGVFMVTAVNAFRVSAGTTSGERSSGTGGFSLIGESALPIYDDLNTEAGREAFGLDGDEMKEVAVVPFRASDGEDASCLNLSKAVRPRLMAVNPQLLADRKSFTFASTLAPSENSPWLDLLTKEADGAIPAIGDMNTIMFALGLQLGDTLLYTDGLGGSFPVKIVGMVSGSLLQGQLIVDEKQYLEKFPATAGYQMFLIDTPPEETQSIANLLTKQLATRGLSLEPSTTRLEQFNTVQNTYIGMFSVLGGLGIILATLGLAVLALRGALERRAELGVMQAVGFTKTKLLHLLIGEHWFLHLGGLLIGIATAVLAVAPMLKASSSGLPITTLVLINGLVLLSGLISTWWCGKWALRGPLIAAIRQE